MELTDEQYRQIMKFVDGEMEEAEQAAFEAIIHGNEELNEEVELYREIRTLGASIEQKLSVASLPDVEVETGERQAGAMLIMNARKQWENEHGDTLEGKPGIFSAEVKDFDVKDHKTPIRMNLWIKAAIAAVLMGVTAVGITWFVSDNKDDRKLVLNKKHSEVQPENKKPANEDSLKDIVSHKANASPDLKSPSLPRSKPGWRDNTKYSQAKAEVLFDNFFRPDLVPQEKEGPFQSAFAYYENKNYAEAIKAFKSADLGPVTRAETDDHQQLQEFYMHYYLGLSYLGANSASKAISELKKAVSADPYLSAKAKWYLSLAYLKTDQVNKLTPLLKEVANQDESKEYKQKAAKLLKKLKEE